MPFKLSGSNILQLAAALFLLLSGKLRGNQKKDRLFNKFFLELSLSFLFRLRITSHGEPLLGAQNNLKKVKKISKNFKPLFTHFLHLIDTPTQNRVFKGLKKILVEVFRFKLWYNKIK